MGKAPKTVTLDIKVHQWIERYAEEKGRKESAIVNTILRRYLGNHFGSWECESCSYVNPFERRRATPPHDLLVNDVCLECYANKP
jgi:hypothetical protein